MNPVRVPTQFSTSTLRAYKQKSEHFYDARLGVF